MDFALNDTQREYRDRARAVTLGADLDSGRVEVITGIAAGEKVARAEP